MILKNLTTGTILTNDLKQIKSFSDFALGLLKKSNPRALLFKTHFGIHTFFLKDEIDIIILDKNNRVAKLKTGLKPNRLFFWNPGYFLAIELPKDTIKTSQTKLNDRLSFLVY